MRGKSIRYSYPMSHENGKLFTCCHPYQKESNQIKYINTESNHPPSIIKQLLLSIESRISSLSSSKEILNDSVTPYHDALEKSGYIHKLKYQANTNTTNNKNQRKRNIIWFNPPYSKNVKNIRKIFLNLYLTRMQ